TAFGAPVFVVYGMANGDTKSRLVVDLRMINRVVVPDSYLFPLNRSITEKLRGKTRITAM
ncbi:hypothetical protein QBC36DRAFT_159450, partial [Triangularia setosa]